MTDVLSFNQGHELFSWGRTTLVAPGDAREQYISALKAADGRNFAPSSRSFEADPNVSSAHRDIVAPSDEIGAGEAMEELSKFMFGVVGGGVAATVFKVIEARVAARQKEKESAQVTLRKYAKPLWLAAHALEVRLGQITGAHHKSLELLPHSGLAIDWYTKDGYYATSTAYLLSAVASWLGLFQRDVVFLEFGEASQTQAFFRLTQDFQATLSQRPSVLWYQYIDGIGSELVDESQRQPMTFSAFCRRLHQDGTFRSFYDQLFQFLKKAAADREYQELLARTQSGLKDIKGFLSRAGVVPKLEGDVERGI